MALKSFRYSDSAEEKYPPSPLELVERKRDVFKIKDKAIDVVVKLGLDGFGELSDSIPMTDLERTRYEETGATSPYD